ncbi:hypothetical protein [Enterobacter pseudoroggenkampii]|uniref:hypothetical protein n=1 Tax=Enterobacter pseudoroggenkampii TaxID=2996112 RepID=UPI002263FA64|nr:hypothetical protein [Enterobacter pseudoroggenkampii]MCX8289099.1 hypothetical protein [Enterobacter pseudoroggenkampii]
MSLKSDYQKLLVLNAALRNSVNAYKEAAIKTDLLLLMIMNDIVKAKKIADFKGIREAILPVFKERSEKHLLHYPVGDDEEYVITRK